MKWSSAAARKSSPSIDAPMSGTTSSTTPSITCPSLSRRPAPWTRPLPCRAGLPEEFGTLRRLLESRMGRRGKREYVQVLRLLETFSQEEVSAAVKDALRLGALSFDAVKHLVLCRLEGRTPQAGPGAISLPATSAGQHHLRQGLHEPVVREGGMSQRSTLLLEHHLKELRLVQLPERVWEAGRSVRRRGCGPPGVPATPS